MGYLDCYLMVLEYELVPFNSLLCILLFFGLRSNNIIVLLIGNARSNTDKYGNWTNELQKINPLYLQHKFDKINSPLDTDIHSRLLWWIKIFGLPVYVPYYTHFILNMHNIEIHMTTTLKFSPSLPPSLNLTKSSFMYPFESVLCNVITCSYI